MMITPLLEIPAIPHDFEEECPAKTIDEHLALMPRQMQEAWPGKAAFLDCDLVGTERISGNIHPVVWFATQIAKSPLVPVTGLERDKDYQTAVAAAVAASESKEVAIRLTVKAMFAEELEANLGSNLKTLGATNLDHVHIILDLKYFDVSGATVFESALPKILNTTPTFVKAKTLTLLGTGFPIDLSDVSQGIGAIERSEWELWNVLRSSDPKLKRMPTFGDYSIAHFGARELDPRTMRVSASIRYTSEADWLIFRGRWLRDPKGTGFEQFRQLSAQVIQNPAFSGRKFSWGDDFIYKCAQQTGGTGNLSQWRQVGNSHHITFVVRQLANLP
jgi:hypothetical protein